MSIRVFALFAATATMMATSSLAQARTGGTRHKLRETYTQITLSASSSRAINVGILDGKIGGSAVHGAIRATATFSGPGGGTGKRIEFDQYGSRTASLKFKLVTNADGSKTDTGSGKWTGGTGRYKGATGSFTFKGTEPPHSTVVTGVFTGTITY